MDAKLPNARRIVSLIPSGTEILYAVGAGDRLAAVSHECDWPIEVKQLPRVTHTSITAACASADIDRQVASMLADRQPLYQLDGELLRRLAPDLIVAQDQCDVCALPLDTLRDCIASEPSLRNTTIIALNPSSLADVMADILRIGRAVGCAEGAQRCARELQSRVDQIAKLAATFAPQNRPRTIVIEWIDPLMISGNWVPKLVELAGGTSGLSTSGRPSQCRSWSDVCALDPEVIVVAACGFDIDRTASEMPTLAGLPGWRHVAAVRCDRVFVADGNAYFNRSGPRLVDSLELLAGLLHPGVFPPPDDTAYRVWRS
jgi:iron complex transport system substrate-binding protein